MQMKLVLSLLLVGSLCAQADIQKDETENIETVVSEVTKNSSQEAVPWALTIEPARIDILFCVTAKTGDSFLDDASRDQLRLQLDKCRDCIEKKDYEQAMNLLDQINGAHADELKSTVVIGAHAGTGLATADISCRSSLLGNVGMSGLLCSIDRSKVSAEAWKEITVTVLNAIGSNQELSYEQAKQLVLTLITKV